MLYYLIYMKCLEQTERRITVARGWGREHKECWIKSTRYRHTPEVTPDTQGCHTYKRPPPHSHACTVTHRPHTHNWGFICTHRWCPTCTHRSLPNLRQRQVQAHAVPPLFLPPRPNHPGSAFPCTPVHSVSHTACTRSPSISHTNTGCPVGSTDSPQLPLPHIVADLRSSRPRVPKHT